MIDVHVAGDPLPPPNAIDDITEEQLIRWRDETPGCGKRIHLNNAGASLMPRPVIDAIQSHLLLEAEIGGYEAAEMASSKAAGAYEAVAQLIGAKSANVAIVENATVGIAQALSAFPFQRDDVVITSRGDYSSNQIMFLSLVERFGIRVCRAEDLSEGGVDPESVRGLLRNERCCLVALTWIPTNSGLVQAVTEVGSLCAEAEVPYLVDACQAVGQLPVNVDALHCDFLAATGRKFLRGPRGAGFLYVSDRVLDKGMYPLFVDLWGAKWSAPDMFLLNPGAKRFEKWEFPHALVHGLGAAVSYANRVGIGVCGKRACHLAEYARQKLAVLQGVRVLDRGRERCAIVSCEIRGWDASELVRRLREYRVNTSASPREYAVIDMDEKRVSSTLRISPHYYNTLGEIDAAILALESIICDAAQASSPI